MAVLAGLCAAAVSACGSGSSKPSTGTSAEAKKPAAQILEDAAAALASAHSVEIQGHALIEKRPSQIALEIEEPANINMTIHQGTHVASVTAVHGSAYLKANAAFYESFAGVPGAAVHLLAGRWIKFSPEEGVGSLVKGLDLATLGKCLIRGTAREAEAFAVTGLTTVNGRPAIAITDTGDRPGSTPGKIYVAASNTPLLLRLLATGKQQPGGTKHGECNEATEATQPGEELTFSRYNAPMKIVAPAGAVELKQLEQGF